PRGDHRDHQRAPATDDSRQRRTRTPIPLSPAETKRARPSPAYARPHFRTSDPRARIGGRAAPVRRNQQRLDPGGGPPTGRPDGTGPPDDPAQQLPAGRLARTVRFGGQRPSLLRPRLGVLALG